MGSWVSRVDISERDHIKPESLVELDFITEREVAAHRHENYELLFVVSGEIDISIERDEYHMGCGDVVLVNAGQPHRYRSVRDVTIARFLISSVRVRELLGMETVLFWCNSVSDRHEAYDVLRRIIARILNESVCADRENRLHLSSLYYQMIYTLSENFMLSPRDERFTFRDGDSEDDRMQRIVTYVRENYRDSISLQDIADMLYLSPTYVSRYIRRQCGVSFVGLINSVRLNHAIEEMMYSTESITKIALDNGFASVAAFNKVFKDEYDQTPSEYRRAHRQASEDARARIEKSHRAAERRVREYLDSHSSSISELDVSRVDLSVSMDDEPCGAWGYAATRLINVGTAADLLDADVQDQVLAAQRDIEFEYVRFWGVFDDEMYLDVHAKEGKRNFSRLDKVFDFLVHHRLKPYVDFGFKSRRIMCTTTKILHDSAEASGFSSTDEAVEFFSELFRHLASRYGSWEVRSWFFEIWERPDGDEESQGVLQYAQMDDADHRRFFEQFDAVARAARSVVPGVRIGGAGFPVRVYGGEGFSHILSIWREFSQMPDFLTLSCYPYQQERLGDACYEKRSTDLSFVRYGIELAHQAMSASDFPDVPVHVTEYNISLSNRNVLNDSCFKAAYLVANAIDCGGCAEYLGHVLLSDHYAEERDTLGVLFGGAGLLAKDGAAKPGYRALEYLHLLYPDIQAMGKSYVITRNPRGSLRLVCHNMKRLGFNYYRVEEDELDIEDLASVMSDAERIRMALHVEGMPDGAYTVKTNLVNAEHGSIQDVWKRMGLESDLTAKEMDYLRMSGIGEISAQTVEVKGGQLDYEWEMRPNEVRYMHVYRK